ncbi:MAG TPA: PPC domain-containing protein [Longimicrobiaceae bacterium]|nr:PPC domain-containing protein [Longimicrobiaceae bacterium]
MQPARRLLVLAPLALALLGAEAAAQTPVRVGQTVSGRLTPSSKKAPEDDSFYDLYTYTGRRGERVRFTLRSSDFDAYLNVGRLGEDGSFESLDTDDDGAGGTNAKVELTLPADGTYAVRANTLRAGDTGAYTLQLERGAAPAPVTTQPVRVGQTVSGRLDASDPKLDDDSHYDLWTFTARAGDGVTASLSSSDFDAFLVLGRMQNGEFQEIESDDDGAGGTDARVSATLAEAGAYTLRVNTLRGGETGAYRLELASGVTAPARAAENTTSPGAGSTVHPQARPIRAGQTVSGTLTESDPVTFDGTHFQDWIYSGKRGERLVVTVRSGAFDSYLQFGRREGTGFSYIGAQDDGAGGNDSLMATTLPEDGDYVLRVNTLHKGTGPYTVKLEKLPPQ